MTDPLRTTQFGPLDVSVLNGRLNAENSRVCLTGIYAPMARVGVRSFVVFMEYRNFQPHIPDLNRRYEFYLIKFAELVWVTVVFPRRYLDTADILLRSLGLHRAGVPISAKIGERFSAHASTRRTGVAFEQYKRDSGANWEMFPLTGPNVFALENIDRHFTYENNPAEYEKAQQAEDEAIRREIETYEQTHAEQIAKLRNATT